MNNKIISNLCTRCGKLRVVAKSWTEEMEMFGKMTAILHSESVCPDIGCQAIVARRLIEHRRAKEEMRSRRGVKS